MASNYVSAGEVIEWKNPSTKVSSGAVVNVGATLGVALVDIGSGETGPVALTGVFACPKAASGSDVAAGDALIYTNAGAGPFAKGAAVTGDFYGAYVAAAPAATADTVVHVRFAGIPHLVK